MSEVARETQTRFGARLAGHDGVRKSWGHFGEAKSAVESISGFGEVATRVLGLADRVVHTTDGAFDVGEKDIDPARAGNFGGGTTAASFEHGVCVTGRGDAA